MAESRIEVAKKKADAARAALADAEKAHGRRSEQAKEAQDALIKAEREHGDLVRSSQY